MMTTSSAIYTVGEVARIVRVKPATVYRWINSGQMAHMRCGPGTVRITGAQLQEYLASCTHTASNVPPTGMASGTSAGQKDDAPTARAPALGTKPLPADSVRSLFGPE